MTALAKVIRNKTSEILKSEIVNAEIERMQKYEMQIQIEGSGSRGGRYGIFKKK